MTDISNKIMAKSKSKDKEFSVSIKVENIVYTSMSKSNDGYSSARLVSKTDDKSYLTVFSEWEGENIPDFAMNLMGFMKAAKMEKSGVCPGKEDLYKIYLETKSTE